MQRRHGTANANSGRASVKNQRRVNTQPAGKKKPTTNTNTNKPTKAAPVGVSGVPLSARFSSLQKEAVQTTPASKKKIVVVNIKKSGANGTKKVAKQQQKIQQQQKQQQQKQKMQDVAQANRTKRQATVNQRRKGLEVTVPTTKGGKKSKANGATAGKSKKKQGGKGKDEKKKKPITGEDLDVEMDSYWHQAGKGPDPQHALLDRQMEEYWAGKPKRDGESAPASESMSA